MKKTFFAPLRTVICISVALIFLSFTQNNSFFERIFANLKGDTNHLLRQSNSTNSNSQQLTFTSNQAYSPGSTCTTLASDEIGGNVWEDFNFDGDKSTEDLIIGVEGIEVAIYNSKNEKVHATFTNEDGDFLFTGLSEATYRVEFVLPSEIDSYANPTPKGVNNNTLIQFVAPGNCAELGVANPGQYCDANAYLITPCFVSGEPSLGGTSGIGDVLVSYPNAAGGQKSDVKPLVLNKDMGTTWGIAFDRTTQSIYAGSMMKRHAGFGGLGIGGIYKTDYSDPTNPILDNWLKLSTIGVDVGLNPRGYLLPANSDVSSTDSIAFDAVGKIGLGDVDISEDNKTLYAINLNDNGSLVAIDIATKSLIKEIAIPNLGCGDSRDVRPWGLSTHNNAVYIGVVCSGEFAGSGDMQFFVLKYDGTTFTSVVNESLNYTKGFVHLSYDFPNAPSLCSDWETWTADFAGLHEAGVAKDGARWCRPQPILSDIEFDRDGSMILAFMDRTGHQTGYLQATTTSNTILGNGYIGGDILRVYNNNGTYELEDGGKTADGNGAGLNNQSGSIGADTVLQGPGGGEYYDGEAFQPSGGAELHQETSLGGIALSYWDNSVALNVMDPTDYFTGGTKWLNNSTGHSDRVFELYNSNSLYGGTNPGDSVTGTFGKAAGLGDLELTCAAAPLELGNYVWNDTNSDGIQNPNETGIDGVVVELIKNGVKIATTTTQNGGQYYFTADGSADQVWENVGDKILPQMEYCIRIRLDETGLNLSIPTTTDTDSGDNSDQRDNDAVIDGDYAKINLTTGDAGSVEHQYDFGFTSNLCLGNYVWLDKNSDGIQDDDEKGIDGLTVELFHENILVASTTTANNGQYLFSIDEGTNQHWVTTGDKVAAFTDYTIRIPVNQTGLEKTALTLKGSTDDSKDNDAELNDTYAEIQLTSGSPGNCNHTYDFGFRPTLCIGDLVWNDANNDGKAETNEAGIEGVELILSSAGDDKIKGTADDVVIAKDTTDVNGKYLFADLDEGVYFIKLNSGIPAGFASSTGSGTQGLDDNTSEPGFATSTDIDNDDNGTQMGAMVMSDTFTLKVCTEPITDGDDNSNTNLSIDFGLTTSLCIGNYVWLDKNSDGIQDDDEKGIDGLTVELLHADTLVASTITANNGYYLFSTNEGLLASTNYTIRIPINQTGLEKTTVTKNDGTDDTKDSDATINGNYAEIQLTSDLAGNCNHSYDFGFRPTLCIGNLVWNDTNNNGIADANEAGLEGVELILSSAGDDKIKGTSDDVEVATETTNENGNYLFSDLDEGVYFVKVNSGIPTGFASSTGSGTQGLEADTYEPGAPTSTDINNDDNGTQMGTMVMSDTFTLKVCTEPITDGDDNSNTNLSIDFGLTASLCIGNYVWLDKNNDGIQDDDEKGIDGLTVELLHAGNLVASTITANNGYYLFSSNEGLLASTDYTIRIPINQTGLEKTTVTKNDGTDDTKDSDATINGNYAEIQLTSDLAGNCNHSYDFGFRPTLCIGNLVWNDANNNGIADANETGLEGVELILSSAGNDKIKGTSDDVEVATETTDKNGNYLFSDLDEGVYFVKVNSGIPTGFASSTGSGTQGLEAHTYEPGATTSTDIDNDDNGTQMGTMVMSDTFTLKVCTEPITDGDDNSNTNMSIDFGFIPCLSIGNLVFEDLNNDGLFNSKEPTMEGIEVQLYKSGADGVKGGDDVLVNSLITKSDGKYLFDGLKPGDYYVKLNSGIPDNMVSSTGSGISSTGNTGKNEPAPNPDNDTSDNDDNGTQMGTMIMSDLFNLELNNEPITDGDNDPNTNLTIDFGLFRLMSLGNLVWSDYDNDGQFNNGEEGIEGVETILFQLGTDGQKDNAVELKRDTTDKNGNYLFTKLFPGKYYVKLAEGIPYGYGSSTGEGIMDVDGVGPSEPAPSPDSDLNNDDNGNQMDYMIMSDIVTLILDDEPINDDDLDNRSNLSVDFGLFELLRLGNLVWEDYDNDGYVDADEPGIEGVSVLLYQVGPDGIKNTADDKFIGEDVTNETGHYIFIRLVPGDYYAILKDGIEGYSSSTGEGTEKIEGLGDFENAPDPDNDVDNEDNGTQMDNMVMSELITMEFMREPMFDGDNFVNSNFTLDFGLFRPLTIGNLVWEDENNNGQLDTNEKGYGGIDVILYEAGKDGIKASNDDLEVAQTTTDANGNYLFENLRPGKYYLKLSNVPSNYMSSNGAGAGQLNGSGPYEPGLATDSDINADDNGTQMGTMIMSDLTSLILYQEPVNDGDANTRTNLTVDFGLVRTNQIKIHNPCTCLNNESGPNAGDGQFAESIAILTNVPNQRWTVMAQTGANVSIGAVALANGIEDGQYRYSFDVKHTDGVGYTIKFSNGADDLTVSNLCHYDPSCAYTIPDPDCTDCTPTPEPDPCKMTFVMGTDGTHRVDSLNCCDNQSSFRDDNTIDKILYKDSTARNDIFTICPQNQWQTLQYNFTEFGLEAGDTLYVYDGRSISDSLLLKASGEGVSATGGWVASTCSPSKNASGCLTFRFVTDGDRNKSIGWDGNFMCTERKIEIKPPNIDAVNLKCVQTTSVVTIEPAIVTADCGIVQDSQIVRIYNGQGVLCKQVCLAYNKTFQETFAIGVYRIEYRLKSDTTKATEAILGVQGKSPICNDLVKIPIGVGCSIFISPDDLLEGSCDTIQDTTYYHITIYGEGKQGEEIIATGGGKTGDYPTITKEQFEQFGGTLRAKIEKRYYEGLTLSICNNGVQKISCSTNIQLDDNSAPVFWGVKNDTLKICDIVLTEAGLSLTKPEASDNCESATVTFEKATIIDDGGVCDTTRIDVKWTATDDKNNVAEITQKVVIIRPDLNDLVKADDIVLSCSEDSEATFYDFEKVGAPGFKIGKIENGKLVPTDTIQLDTKTYKCGYILVRKDAIIPNDCGEKLFRHWDILDWCDADNGPIRIDTQFINLKDTTAPTFLLDSIPFSQLDLDHNACTFDVTKLEGPTATDNCSAVSVRIDSVFRIEDGELWPVNKGDLTTLDADSFRIRWIAEDACHEQIVNDSIIQDILIEDNTKPSAVCADNFNLSIGTTQAKIHYSNFDAGSYDACGIVTTEISRDEENWGEYVEFDCIDVHQLIKVYLRVTDAAGNENTCWTTVNIEDKVAPICSNLPDRTGTCDEQHAEVFGPTTDANEDSKMSETEWQSMTAEQMAYYNTNYGNPNCSDNLDCQALVINQEYQLINWPCGMIEIKRRWNARDWQGEGNISNWSEQNIKIEYKANWKITLPADWSGTCNSDIPESNVLIENGTCDLLAVEMDEKTYTTVEDACVKIVRTFTIINWCNFEAGMPTVRIARPEATHGAVQEDFVLTAVGYEAAGKLEYTQVLKIRDTEAPVITIVEPDACINGVDGDAAPHGKEDITPGTAPYECDELKTWEGFAEDCSGTDNLTWVSRIYEDGELVKESNTKSISYVVKNKSIYKAEFWAYDGCGNSSGATTDETKFWDCKKPTPYCLHGSAVALMPAGMVQIWAKDLNLNSYDNCTSADRLKIRVWHQSVGNVPTTLEEVLALPQQINFTCAYLGTQDVSLYVIDDEDNWDFCTTYVTIQDNNGACEGLEPQAGFAIISGTIMDWKGKTVEEVQVANANINSMMTEEDGQYHFEVAMDKAYTIEPTKDIHPLNGVSTFDLVLISKHILGIAKFDNPYQQIAADVNNSGSITAYDMVQLRRLILNIDTQFNSNTSWKFVETDYSFTTDNPVAEAYPTLATVSNLEHDMQMDFTAIKVGDVNGNAKPNTLVQSEDRNTDEIFEISTEDKILKVGERYTVTFATKQLATIQGYQFTLGFEGLQFEKLTNGVTGIENFGMHRLEQNYLTTSWNKSGTTANETDLFTLTFTAESAGKLSEQLSLVTKPTAVEAYNEAGQVMDVQLTFTTPLSVEKTFELYQNEPNPFLQQTQIGFYLPANSKVVLSLRDEMGRLLRVIKEDRAAGEHFFTINATDLPKGLIYYQINTQFGTQTKKMLRIE